MKEFLEFSFSGTYGHGFWRFIGCYMFVGLVATLIFKIYNRFWRFWTIRKHGYPPVHCDADGDFKDQTD